MTLTLALRRPSFTRRFGVFLQAAASLGVLLWAALSTPCVEPHWAVYRGAELDCLSLPEYLSPLLISLALWVMGTWVAKEGRRLIRSFFFGISAILASGMHSAIGSDIGFRLFFLLLIWAAPLQFYVHWDLIGRPDNRWTRRGRLGLVLMALVLSLLPLHQSRAALSGSHLYAPWIVLVILTLVTSITMTALLLITEYRRDRREAHRRPIRLVSFGNVSALVPVIVLSLLPRLVRMDVRIPYEMTFPAFLLSPLLYVYASVPHQHGRIGSALKSVAVVYWAMLLFLCTYVWGAIVVGLPLLGDASTSTIPLIALSAAAMLVATQTIRPLERFIQRVWYSSTPDYAQTVSRLARSLVATLDRGRLEFLLLHDLSDSMGLASAGLFLRDARWRLAWTAGKDMSPPKGMDPVLNGDGPLVRRLRAERRPMSREELRQTLASAWSELNPLEQWLLSRADVDVWLPLAGVGPDAEAMQCGLLVLGRKITEDLFTTEDMRLLATVTDQASIAAQNVLLSEEKALTEERLSQAVKLEAIGRLAAGIAHDFNNILTSILGYAYLIQSRNDIAAEAHDDLDIIVQEGQRAARLIQQILDFARKSMVQFQPLDMLSLLKETIKLLQRTLPESVQLRLQIGPADYIVRSDPTMMSQVMTNLAVNAVDAMPDGGELHIILDRLVIARGQDTPLPDMEPGDWVVITVRDTGIGIPEDALAHIFEPFFTTKEVGKGTGLGLAQVYGIVKQHGGAIDVETAVGVGTAFKIYFPALEGADKKEQPAVKNEIVPGHGEAIMVVEDEPVVLRSLTRMLELANYRVVAAHDAREAVELFQRQGDDIALLITDMVMPGAGGWDLITFLRRRRPNLKALVITGYPLEEEGHTLLSLGIVDWLPKPVTAVGLTERIAEMLSDNGQDALDSPRAIAKEANIIHA
jgi:signal transduction histidine kinase/ActR/RegA family two-component response regulator